MVDAGPLYYSMGYYSVGNAILKYMGRGFRSKMLAVRRHGLQKMLGGGDAM